MRLKVLFLIVVLFCTVPLTGNAMTLGDGLRVVAERARQIEISKFETAIAREISDQARAGLYPSLNLHAANTWLRYRPEAFFGFQSVPVSQRQFISYGIDLRQTVFSFGRVTGRVNAAEESVRAYEADESEIRNRVAMEFINAFFDYVESEKLLEVARREVERFNSHRRDAAEFFKEGMVTKNDLLHAEVALADARQRLIDAENRLAVSKSRINILLLRDLNADIELTAPGVHPSAGITLDAAIEAALRNRKIIQVIARQIRAKENEIQSLKAAYLPTIYVGGGYQFEENEYMLHEGNWAVTAGLQWNIFAGGSKRAAIRKAEKELSILKLRRGEIMDGIRLSVKQAYLNMKAASEKLKVANKSVEQARENHRLQRLRYEEGLGTSTDVIDAVTLLAKAETNHMMAVSGWNKTEAAFLFASGADLPRVYK